MNMDFQVGLHKLAQEMLGPRKEESTSKYKQQTLPTNVSQTFSHDSKERIVGEVKKKKKKKRKKKSRYFC